MKPLVLIVDDSATNRYLLAFHLRVMGVEVLEAPDGRQALELAAAQPPAVVLLDLHMPEMDGFEVAERLWALPGLQHLPVFAVTANVASQTRRAALEAGFAGYITKPIDPEIIAAAIRPFLNPPAP